MRFFAENIEQSKSIIGYRIGVLQHSSWKDAGGIWFTDDTVSAVVFYLGCRFMLGKDVALKIFKCKLDFKNSYIFESFYGRQNNSYLGYEMNYGANRSKIMEDFQTKGYDSVIINESEWWQVYLPETEQYVAFDIKQVKILNQWKINFNNHLYYDSDDEFNYGTPRQIEERNADIVDVLERYEVDVNPKYWSKYL